MIIRTTDYYTNQDLLRLINQSSLTLIGYSGSNYTQFISLIKPLSINRLPFDGNLDEKKFKRLIRIDQITDNREFYLLDSEDIDYSRFGIQDIEELILSVCPIKNAKIIVTIPYYKSLTGPYTTDTYKTRNMKLLYRSDLALQIHNEGIKIMKNKIY